MKYPKLILILSSVLAALVVVLFLTSLFSVKDSEFSCSVYGEADFEELEEILGAYKGKNILFIDTENIRKEINDKTFFNAESVKKIYPSTIGVTLSARQERYAVQDGDEYYILDEAFTVTEKRASVKNRSDALDNIVLSFKGVEPPALSIKTRVDAGANVEFGLIGEITRGLSSPRDHITAITFDDRGYGDYYILVSMREGVTVEIRKARERIAEKVQKAFDKYFALSDKDKLSGRVICYELVSGEIVAYYECGDKEEYL